MRKASLILASILAGLWLFGERGRLMRRSTRALLHEMGGWHKLLSLEFWHAYVYARWSNQYIGGALRYAIPRTRPIDGDNQWADVYHGKVLPTEQAQALISINEPIPRQDLEQIIPFPTARDLVLNGPPDIAVYECPCRAAQPDPCQPTQVCMIVGQPFVDFMLEHNPHTSRRLSTGEALALLQAEHERGHIHAAYFKDVMLNRFYAICNCCPCCCGGIASMRHGVPMVTASGYVAQVDDARCVGCGHCAATCPFDAIHVAGTAAIAWEACMGCGVCLGQCPADALALARDARKGAPLDVGQLTAPDGPPGHSIP